MSKDETLIKQISSISKSARERQAESLNVYQNLMQKIETGAIVVIGWQPDQNK